VLLRSRSRRSPGVVGETEGEVPDPFVQAPSRSNRLKYSVSRVSWAIVAAELTAVSPADHPSGPLQQGLPLPAQGRSVGAEILASISLHAVQISGCRDLATIACLDRGPLVSVRSG